MEDSEIQHKFDSISMKCLWRIELRCSVLIQARGYETLGGANCNKENCGIMLFISEWNKEGISK